MAISRKLTIIALAAGLCVPLTAQAHRAWLLPSATIVSGDNAWITIDAAVSNDLFYFEHFPLRIAGVGGNPEGMPEGRGRPGQLNITAPDGSKVEPKNGAVGRYRTTFDFPLMQKGTYKVAVTNESAFVSWKEGGQQKRWSGPAADVAKHIPANAEDLRASYNQSRMEVFVTSGKPSGETLKLTNAGLELMPVTHPNDLVAGQAATFKLMLDGKPAAGVEVEVVPGGNRYRDKLGDLKLKSDAEGKFQVKWPDPGMYWIEATVRDDKTPVKELKQRRAAYIATFEVLPQ